MHSLNRHVLAASQQLPRILPLLNISDCIFAASHLQPSGPRCRVQCLANMPPRQLLILEDVVLTATHKPNRRLDEVLADLFPERYGSATGVKRAIRRREIRVNGALARTDSIVQQGDNLQVVVKVGSAPVMPEASTGREGLDLTYEDEHFACVVKPQGIPTQGKGEGSVQGRVKYCLQPTHLPGALFRPHQVHRLDAGTGGLVLIAKTRAAVAALGTDLAAHNMQKRYLALVIGRLEGDGIVNFPLQGKPAVSLYSAVQHSPSETFGWLTWVSLWPRTGRTHQLRKHMAYIGHPILGDMQYKYHRKPDCQAVPVTDVQQYVPQLRDLVREVLPEQQAKMAAAAQAAAVQAAVIELQQQAGQRQLQQPDPQQQQARLHSKRQQVGQPQQRVTVQNETAEVQKASSRAIASIQIQAVAGTPAVAVKAASESKLGTVQSQSEVLNSQQHGNVFTLLDHTIGEADSDISSMPDNTCSGQSIGSLDDAEQDPEGRPDHSDAAVDSSSNDNSSSIKGQLLKDGSTALMCLWAVQLQLLHPITREPLNLCINTPVKVYQHICDVEAQKEQS